VTQGIDPADLNVLGFPAQRLPPRHESGEVRKVRQVHDGAWIKPILRGYRMICCFCGLTHLMDFRVTPERGLEMRGWRVNGESGE
jgi:hypothetical protein